MLIPCLSETMHACRIRLSAAVLQGRDGSGLGGTLSSSAELFAIHSANIWGRNCNMGWLQRYTYSRGGCYLAGLAACLDTLRNCCFRSVMPSPGPQGLLHVPDEAFTQDIHSMLQKFQSVYQNSVIRMYNVYTQYITKFQSVCHNVLVSIYNIHCIYTVYVQFICNIYIVQEQYHDTTRSGTSPTVTNARRRRSSLFIMASKERKQMQIFPVHHCQ